MRLSQLSPTATALFVSAVAVGTLACVSLYVGNASANPTDNDETASANVDTDWQDDPACRMVFFAVLEGLYCDGVPNDVVNSLVPRSSEKDGSIKENFVVQCPLCHPVFEALSLYQRRGAFQNGDGKRSTFGDGIDKDLRKRLTSTSREERLRALRLLVRRWVERRMTEMRLTDDERTALTDKINQRSQEGRKHLQALMQKDESYNTGWSLYWGCAACNGTTDACRTLNQEGDRAEHGTQR